MAFWVISGFFFCAVPFCLILSIEEKNNNFQTTKQRLVMQLHQKKQDLLFLKKNRDFFQHLNPYNRAPQITRLMAGKILKQTAKNAGLLHMNFSLMPEKKSFIAGHLPVLTTPISILFKGLWDKDLFIFVQNLSTQFSGFLIPRRLTLERVFLDSKDLAFGTELSDEITGSYIFDWVVVDEEVDF